MEESEEGGMSPLKKGLCIIAGVLVSAGILVNSFNYIKSKLTPLPGVEEVLPLYKDLSDTFVYTGSDGKPVYVKMHDGNYFPIKHDGRGKTPLGLVDDSVKDGYDNNYLSHVIIGLKGTIITRTDRDSPKICPKTDKPNLDYLTEVSFNDYKKTNQRYPIIK